MTPAERILWDRLRNRQFLGLKFRRQHPLGRFIADFYCAEHRLVIELDGDIHRDHREYDQVRTEVLQDHGYQVLRFSNDAVLQFPDEVLGTIAAAVEG